jgi:DNA replication protein DnaC
MVRGCSVLFITAPALMNSRSQAHAQARLDERVNHLTKPKRLIGREFGLLPRQPRAVDRFFQLVPRRYERGSLLVASPTAASANGAWCSATPSPPPPSSTRCCISVT